MFRRRRAPREPTWGHSKLVALLAAGVAVVLLVLTGVGLAIYYTVTGTAHPDDTSGTTASVSPSAVGAGGGAASGSAAALGGSAVDRSWQDLLAAAAMASVDLQASRPGPVSTRNPGTLTIPRPTQTGAAGVPTGFPHTPEGAFAELAAIDQTAFQSGGLDGMRQVITAWAAPGGPTAESWSAIKAMAELLDSAGLSGGASGQLALVVTPLMGLIKGSVGPDLVVPCVDFEFDATITQTVRVADADCQRMQWSGGRWVIGAGPEPANPPSVWPDTDTAIDVGYRDVRHA